MGSWEIVWKWGENIIITEIFCFVEILCFTKEAKVKISHFLIHRLTMWHQYLQDGSLNPLRSAWVAIKSAFSLDWFSQEWLDLKLFWDQRFYWFHLSDLLYLVVYFVRVFVIENTSFSFSWCRLALNILWNDPENDFFSPLYSFLVNINLIDLGVVCLQSSGHKILYSLIKLWGQQLLWYVLFILDSLTWRFFLSQLFALLFIVFLYCSYVFLWH